MSPYSVKFADDADDLKFIDGIWQFAGFDFLESEEYSNQFFSLHYDGNALILVNFDYIKVLGDPLAASFIGQGNTREFLLEPLGYAANPMLPSLNIKHNLRVVFTSDTEAKVTPIFESPIIDGATFKIRKVFK